MKRLLLLLFGFCISCLLFAKDYLLVIDFTDGTDMSFALAKQPVLTFANQRLVVTMDGQRTEFELINVLSFHFKEGSSDIRSPRMDDNYTIAWQGEDLIVISNSSSNTMVRLYGIDGIYYPNRVCTNGDRLEITFSALPKGIYLININNNRTLKINRK